MGIHDRISFGHLGMFVPTGKPVRIGPRGNGIGEVDEYGDASNIKLVVGLNKGTQAQNTGGRCGNAPVKFTVAEIDDAFYAGRAAQVGRKNVGATRMSGQGWYEGDPEQSVAFDIAFIPNEREPDFTTFRANMNALAELLAEKFCQDSVLILRDDGGKRTVAAARWVP